MGYAARIEFERTWKNHSMYEWLLWKIIYEEKKKECVQERVRERNRTNERVGGSNACSTHTQIFSILHNLQHLDFGKYVCVTYISLFHFIYSNIFLNIKHAMFFFFISLVLLTLPLPTLTAFLRITTNQSNSHRSILYMRIFTHIFNTYKYGS